MYIQYKSKDGQHVWTMDEYLYLVNDHDSNFYSCFNYNVCRYN